MARPLCTRLLLCLSLIAALSSCRPANLAREVDPPRPSAAPTATEEPARPLAEYHLEMSLDTAAARLSGKERVTFPNHTGAPLEEIVFRLYSNLPQRGGSMAIREVTVEGQPAAFSLRAADTSLGVSLGQVAPPRASLEHPEDAVDDVPMRDARAPTLSRAGPPWERRFDRGPLRVGQPDAAPAHAHHRSV